MADDRLERLEPEKPTREPDKPGPPRLDSFSHLEVGATPPEPPAPGPARDDRDWSPDFPVPEAPWGVRVEREAGALRITRRWLCLGTLRPLFALWAIAVFLGFCWIPMHRSAPQLFLLYVAVLGAAPAYMTAARFVNRSVIQVDAERLTVRHGPLPGWGSLDIPTRDIGRVSTGGELVHTRSGNFMSYEVALTRKNGEELPLLSEGELSSDQAAFIARQLEEYLSAAAG